MLVCLLRRDNYSEDATHYDIFAELGTRDNCHSTTSLQSWAHATTVTVPQNILPKLHCDKNVLEALTHCRKVTIFSHDQHCMGGSWRYQTLMLTDPV